MARSSSRLTVAPWCIVALAGAGTVALAQPPPAPTGAEIGSRATTFTEDVAPILFTRCATCHRSGGSAPFSLLTYNEARPRAARIASAARARLMPPWKAEPPGTGDPGDGFLGQQPLPANELETLERWVKDGAREGDPRRMPPLPAWNNGWQLGTPDLILTPQDVYTLPTEGSDRFRVFVLPIPVSRTRYVRGVELRTDDATIVHHANILIDRTSNSRDRHHEDPTLGESGLLAATAEYPPGQLLGWTPGQPDALVPPSMAWPLEPGTDLVVQLHLVPDGTPRPIRFSVGLYFGAAPPQRTPVILRLGRRDIDIPAGQRTYALADAYTLPVDAEIQALKPHAHYRAREVSAVAELPNGSTRRLLLIKDWDFRWQHVYRYVTPVVLPKGTKLTLHLTYDNSASPRRNPSLRPERVRWGPRSSDEMGDLWLQVLTRSERESTALANDFRLKWVRDEIAGYEGLAEREPGNPALKDALAWLNLQEGRWEDAAVQYALFVQMKPESPVGHFNLATARMLQGRFDLAVASFLEAIRLDPGYAAAHSNLGNTLSRLGRLDEALDHYRTALDIAPARASTHNNIGTLLMRRGKLEAALPHFTEALRLDARLPDSHYNLGLLYWARSEPERAIRHMQDVVAIRPNWPPALTALAWMLATGVDERHRDAPRAIELAQEAATLTARRCADALDALAAAYAAAERFDAAIDSIDEALRAGGTQAALLERKSLYRGHRPFRASAPANSPLESVNRGGPCGN